MERCCCDLCGTDDYQSFPRAVTGPLNIVICRKCGFIYTNPRFDSRELNHAYDEEFTADPGAHSLANSEDPGFREENFAKACDAVRRDILPHITPFVDPRGKKWLELRFRSGALLAELHALGARVSGVDPFEANLRWLQARLPHTPVYSAPVTDLFEPIRETFDVISMLTIHVPSHVPSPSHLLKRAAECLKPGGLLLIDEKDVTRPGPTTTQFAIQHPYGMVHFCHLTLNSGQALVEKAGFEVIHAGYVSRTTAQRHFLIVARRPDHAMQPRMPRLPVDNPRRLYWRLLWQYLRLTTRRKRRGATRRVMRILGHS